MIFRSELQKRQRSIALSSLAEEVKHIEEYTKKRKKGKNTSFRRFIKVVNLNFKSNLLDSHTVKQDHQ